MKIGNQRISRDNQDYRFIKIGQNTVNGPGDLRRFAVTQTLVRHQLTLVWKLLKRVRSLAERKIQRGIFQGDALSPLLFIIAMMPLNHILRKCIAGYKLSGSQEKINHLMYMDGIKLFTKNEKELETLINGVKIYSQDIEMEFGIEKCAMLVMKSGKRHWLMEWNYQITTKSERLEKMKPTNTWVSWRLTPPNKWK